MNIKQKIYNLIAMSGIKTLMFIFPEYFGHDPVAPSDRYVECPFALKNLPVPPARVLDVGCAGSFFPLILSSIGYDTYAVDIRNYSILNRLEYKNFHFFKESIIKTSFPENYFDAVCAISTIEHIGLSGRYGAKEDNDGDEKALKEMTRIVKPGGTILLTIPFGRAKIIRPFTKIYDSALVSKLTSGLLLETEEYYKQDSHEDWYKCGKEEAETTESNIYKFVLCLLRLKKQG
jgi:ubiquinone/menaquinone biosynthesis C-methylase UbiE